MIREFWDILTGPFIFILILQILICLMWLKSMTIGSDFNFGYWFKYKKIYSKWYFSRPTFEDYLKEIHLEKK